MTLNKAQLVENYVSQIVEGLDVEQLAIVTFDLLVREYDTYTEEQIVGEIEELYGKEVVAELLESVDPHVPVAQVSHTLQTSCLIPVTLHSYLKHLMPDTMTFDRSQLIEDYIQQLIEGMDYKTMECLVYDTLQDNLADYTDEQLITEVTEYNPELLED